MIRLGATAVLAAMLAGCGSEPADVVWSAVEGLGRSACEAAQSCANTCPEGQRYDGRGLRCLPDR